MTAIEKAEFFIECAKDMRYTCEFGTFKSFFSHDKPVWKVVNGEEYQLEIDFKFAGRWLTSEEEILLKMLGAVNVFAYTGGVMGEPLTYTNNLNSACCWCGCFKFEDDEEKETFPLPSLVLEMV